MELCRPELCRIIEEYEGVESLTIHEIKQKHLEDSPTFMNDFIKDTTTLLHNLPNNSFLLNDLTVIKNIDMVFEDNIYCNLAQLLKTGEKQLHSLIEDQLTMSKRPISAKITLNNFQLPGVKSTKKRASSVDKRLSPAFITKLRSAVTYRREHARLLFSSEMIIVKVCLRMVLICIIVVKTNSLNQFEQVTNRIEISSSAALLIEPSPKFKSDTYPGTFEEFTR